MMLREDQRGFVLSGVALLLVLPAMLLVASCFSIVGTGGEATSLQAISDKVTYTGHDIGRMIRYMENQKLPITDITLRKLADSYRAATGLLVDISLPPHTVILAREKLDQGEEFGLDTTLFGFGLEVNAENEGPVIDVEEFEFGAIERSGQGVDFTLSIQQDNILVEVVVGGGWIEVRYTAGEGVRGVFTRVKDPRSAAQYMSTVKL